MATIVCRAEGPQSSLISETQIVYTFNFSYDPSLFPSDSDSDSDNTANTYSLYGKDHFTSYSLTYFIGSSALKLYPECILNPSTEEITYSLRKDIWEVHVDWDSHIPEIRVYSEDVLLHGKKFMLQVTCTVLELQLHLDIDYEIKLHDPSPKLAYQDLWGNPNSWIPVPGLDIHVPIPRPLWFILPSNGP